METKNKSPFEREALKMARRLFKHESTVEFVLHAIDTHFRETLSIEQKKQICGEAIVLNLAKANEPEDDILERTKVSLELCLGDISEMELECGLGEMAELSHLQAISKHIDLAINEIHKLYNL